MIVLDTCIVLRIADGTLPASMENALSQERWAMSALSAWEIAIKHALGKLPLDATPDQWWPSVIAALHIEVLPFTDVIALRAGSLPPVHADPFDRGIIATALQHHFPLASIDRALTPYGAACGVDLLEVP